MTECFLCCGCLQVQQSADQAVHIALFYMSQWLWSWCWCGSLHGLYISLASGTPVSLVKRDSKKANFYFTWTWLPSSTCKGEQLEVHFDWHCVLSEAVAPIKFAADFGMDSITSEHDLRLYMRQAGTSFRSLDGWSSIWLEAVNGHTKNGPFRLACNVWLWRILEGPLLRIVFAVATDHAYICMVLQLFCTCCCKHVWYYLTKMRHATQTHHGAGYRKGCL